MRLHACICMHAFACIHQHLHACMHLYACMHAPFVYMHTNACMHVCTICIRACMHEFVCMHAFECMHLHAYINGLQKIKKQEDKASGAPNVKPPANPNN